MKRQPVIELAAGFSLLVALLLAIGWLGVRQIAALNADLDQLVKTRWKTVELSREALSYSTANNRITMEVFLLRDRAQIQSLLRERAANSAKISTLLKTLQSRATSTEERTLLAEVERNRAPYIESYTNALRLLLEAGDVESARVAMVGETLPYLGEYHAAWSRFVSYQGELMDRAAHQSASTSSATRQRMLTLLALAVAVALLISWVVTRRLRKALAEQQQAEEGLRHSQEQLEERVQQRTAELRAALDDLSAARDAALASVRAKATFLANMSHEIRTPMNGVIGMTSLLLNTSLTDEQREFTETIRTSGDGLMTIINDVLDFSKIEAGKLTFETLDFDLREVVESSLSLHAERAHAKGLEIVASVAPGVPTALRGDPGRLGQVLNNLVSNAIKFTSAGEVVVRVSTDAVHETDAAIRFEIVDTGIGIPIAVQQRLFQSFTQADQSTTRKYGGTGLGLAIARHLVTLMHGEIGIRSEAGAGSTFWFTAQFETQPIGRSAAVIPIADLRGIRVLVVDDNRTNRRILECQLGSWGMQPVAVATAAEALDVLRRSREGDAPFRLGMLDLQMPDVDGFMLAAAIKADERIADTPLILLTSLGQALLPTDRAAAGFADCLLKPIRQARLLAAIMAVVTADRGQRAGAPNAITRPSPARKTRRILLAEDNVINQKVVTSQLKQLGCSADVVANGAEAVRAVEQVGYDLVMLDCQMPVMDGYDAARELRRRGFTSNDVTLIALTASAMEGDRERCLAAGMDDYVSKPVRIEDLSAVLDRWMTAGMPAASLQAVG